MSDSNQRGPKTNGSEVFGADQVETISVDRIVASDPVLHDEKSAREKATELQMFWSLAALAIFVVMAALTITACWQWYAADRGYREALIITGTNDVSTAAMDMYTRLSDLAFERFWKVIDRLVMGGLMSLLTLIVGYIFGVRRQAKGHSDH